MAPPACPRPSWPAVQRLQGSDGDAEARDALVAQGYEIKLTPPDAAAAFFRSEAARMAQVVKNANVKLD